MPSRLMVPGCAPVNHFSLLTGIGGEGWTSAAAATEAILSPPAEHPAAPATVTADAISQPI
jgi:hypothetical protein